MTDDPDVEMTLLRNLAALGAANLDFYRYLLDQVRGTELVVEDDADLPVRELADIAADIAQCTPAMRERLLLNKLARLRCWHYRAINEQREVWIPWLETLRCFQARSARVEYWTDPVITAETARAIKTWLEGKYRDFAWKK